MTEPRIQVDGLVKTFEAFKAVDGVSFAVEKGEVLGFLGPNGAGKSTTMKMITGYLTPSAGRVSICGLNVLEEPIAAQRLMGYLPEGAPAYAEMSPLQFLNFVAEVRGLTGAGRAKAVDAAIDKTQLHGVLHQSFETLSKGFKRRVGLAQAVLHDPPVLIMDEPTDGLDPNQKHAVRQLINDMAKDKAIVISTHILEEVDAICSRALIIDRGKVVIDGTPLELAAKSSFHNAVTLVVAPSLAGEVRQKAEALADVDRVEQKTEDDDAILTVFPKNHKRIIDAVSGLVSSSNWDLKGLYVEAGRLDDVFRELTSSDALENVSSPAAAASDAA